MVSGLLACRPEHGTSLQLLGLNLALDVQDALGGDAVLDLLDHISHWSGPIMVLVLR